MNFEGVTVIVSFRPVAVSMHPTWDHLLPNLKNKPFPYFVLVVHNIHNTTNVMSYPWMSWAGNFCIVNIEINTWSWSFFNLQIDLISNQYPARQLYPWSTGLNETLIRGGGQPKWRDKALILKLKVPKLDIAVNWFGIMSFRHKSCQLWHSRCLCV